MRCTISSGLRILGMILLLILLFCLTAQTADAASYTRITLDEDSGSRVKVGDRYFWMEGDHLPISVNGGMVLYSSTSKTGKGVEIFRLTDESAWTRINEVMVTNGSKIYFAAGDIEKDIIYSCNADGTSLKKLKTLKPTESELESTYTPYYEIASVYNGRLYIVKRSSLDPAHHTLRSIGLSSGKITTHITNCDVDWASGRGRYIYYRHHNGGGPNDTTLYAFDCKNKKSYKITDTLGARAIGTYDGKMYYYKMVTGEDGSQSTKVYSCTFSGKEDKRLFTLKNGAYQFRRSGKIYCLGRHSDSPWATPYCFDLKTGALKEISSGEFMTAQSSGLTSGAN